jgi:hypothetical protein
MIPQFRVVQFAEPNPETGNKFYIEWYLRKTLWGFIPLWREWEIFIDPATRATGGDWGYKTLPEANNVIHRYKVNMQPQYHYHK